MKPSSTNWGSEVERERRSRIRLSLWAYAYEFEADSLVPDAHFDGEAALIDPQLPTGNEKLDKFFREEFDHNTGVWVRRHPELAKVKSLYLKVKGKKPWA